MKGEYKPTGVPKHPTEYVVDTSTGCWQWMRGMTPNGYGYAQRNGAKRGAHRLYWEEVNGPIPSGMTIDHLCNNPSCVNPAHMTLATLRENILRGSSPWAVNARKTHCPAGHQYDASNTYITKQGKRHCRLCDAAKHRRHRAERSAING